MTRVLPVDPTQPFLGLSRAIFLPYSFALAVVFTTTATLLSSEISWRQPEEN